MIRSVVERGIPLVLLLGAGTPPRPATADLHAEMHRAAASLGLQPAS